MEADHKEQKVVLEFQRETFDLLELIIEQGKNGNYDWTYWGDIDFQKNN